MDIKPPNFIIVKGKMKIIDLGCAEKIPPGQEYLLCKVSKGTEGYMGPECLDSIDGKYFKYSLRTDSYALGILLEYILSKASEIKNNEALTSYLNSIVKNTLQDNQFMRKSAVELLDELKGKVKILPMLSY